MSVLKIKDDGVWKDIPTIVGEAAGFGTVTATVDTNVGTPTVVVTSSGEDTAKNFAFQFKNLGYDDSDLQSDFSDLADDFDVLQGQFDTAVAAVTTDTEVTDIRVGADGITDTTAGASVRRQFTDVKSDFEGISAEADNLFWFTDTSERTINGLTLTFLDKSTIKVNGTASNNVNLFSCGNVDASGTKFPSGTYMYKVVKVSGDGAVEKLRYGSSFSIWNALTEKTFDSNTSIFFRLPTGKSYTDAVFRVMVQRGTSFNDVYVEGGKTADDKIARINEDAINRSVYDNKTAASFLDWEIGTITGTNGEKGSAEGVIRTSDFVYPRWIKDIKTINNCVFYLFAYQEDGTYIGAWDKASETFIKNVYNWYNSADFSVVDPSNQYKYKIVSKPNTAIDIAIVKASTLMTVDRIALMESAGDESQNESNSEDIVALKSTSVWKTEEDYVPPLTLLHFSDPHNCSQNNAFIADYYAKHKNEIDDILCTGDICGNYKSDTAISNWFQYFTDPYVLVSLGNHDYYADSSYETLITQAEAYSSYFSPTIASWGADYTVNKTYWYKDYAESGVRLIGLDNMLDTSDMAEQVAWLESVLADAVENSYAVMTAMHCPPSLTGVKIDSSFTSRIALPHKVTDIGLDGNSVGIQVAIDAFINNGGVFICHLMGHWHFDALMYSSTYPNQPILVVGTASSDDWANSIINYPVNRDVGTKYQNLFNIFTVDAKDGLFKVLRIGADRDAFMRSRKTLCYDYINRTVIYSD